MARIETQQLCNDIENGIQSQKDSSNNNPLSSLKDNPSDSDILFWLSQIQNHTRATQDILCKEIPQIINQTVLMENELKKMFE